jgi:hypothetical protein
MTKQLSPAAEAVLDAAVDAYGINYSEFHCCADRVAAAALRVAADQVVPDKPAPDVASFKEFERWDAKRFVRLQLRAIAAELEGANA